MSAKSKPPTEGEVWAPKMGAVVIVLKIRDHYELANIYLPWGVEKMNRNQLKDYLTGGGFTRLGNINAK